MVNTLITLFGENEPKYNEHKMEYLNYGREECPESHRPHFQGYVRFKVRKRFSSAKALVPGAHLEKSKGSS